MGKIQIRRNQCMRLLNRSFKIIPNVVRLNIHNSPRHELAKCKKAYELITEGKEIVTEARFKNGTIADILVLDDFRVYEIRYSETDEESLDKIKKYPIEVDIVFLDADEVLENE